MVENARELNSMLGGALSESQCELIFAPDSTRALANEILTALREGRSAVVEEEDLSAYEQTSEQMRAILLALPNAPTGGDSQQEADGLQRQVAELESTLAITTEQLAQAKHRKERMALLEPASAKEVASLAAYDQKMRHAISDELESCTAAELECVDAIAGIDSALIDLLARLHPTGPFLLPPSRMDELSDANSEFFDAVQTLMDGGGKSADADGVAVMRQIAMQELQRLQDLFVNTELDRTDALQMKDEALAIEMVARAQLAELANSADIRVQVSIRLNRLPVRLLMIFPEASAALSLALSVACASALSTTPYRMLSLSSISVSLLLSGPPLIRRSGAGAKGGPGNRGGKGCGKTQRYYKLDQTSREATQRLGDSATARTQKLASAAHQGGRLCAAACREGGRARACMRSKYCAPRTETTHASL